MEIKFHKTKTYKQWENIFSPGPRRESVCDIKDDSMLSTAVVVALVIEPELADSAKFLLYQAFTGCRLSDRDPHVLTMHLLFILQTACDMASMI